MAELSNYPQLGEITLAGIPDLTLAVMGEEDFASELNLPAWINGRRVPETGKLDIRATADHLGIPLSFEELDKGRGLTKGIDDDEELEIVIDPRHDMQEVTFGHEVGHIILKLAGITHPKFSEQEQADLDRGRYSPDFKFKFQHGHRIEMTCDIIGVHYALPLADLTNLEHVNEQTVIGLMDGYGTLPSDTIYQLIRAGKLPRRFQVLSKSAWGPDEGQADHVDYICYDCRTDFGSCEETEMSDLTLDFNDYEFGGEFPICKSLPILYSKNQGEI